MARSLANATLVSPAVLDSISFAIFRRGYAAQGAVSAGAKAGRAMTNRRAAEGKAVKSEEGTEKAAWGPDPKTGYYRPGNSAGDGIDVAELRAVLLGHKD
ncbi:hypothetical protein MLD38_032991 [Melastoma candidum]|uniref:Uncharacterized protein n=1 Tax=Melastoma candidum TaxID=119954 RepID=A0ACB9M758_9MYRT|nr:hypothetical protein MLD38_032991 [Melastoma candidum]